MAALGGFKAWRGASFAALYPPLGLALVLALIVFNKVGSPQYLTWIAAPIIVGLVIDRRRWFRPALFALLTAGLTFWIYPVSYGWLLTATWWAAALLTLRNAMLLALLIWMVVRLARLPVTSRVRIAVAQA